MPDTKQKDKPERMQFGKGANAKEILTGIKAAQDRWAKSHPELAHRLYPKIFDAAGNRIQ